MKYETFTEFEFVYLVLSLFPFHLSVWQIHDTYSSIILSMLSVHMARVVQHVHRRSSSLDLLDLL